MGTWAVYCRRTLPLFPVTRGTTGCLSPYWHLLLVHLRVTSVSSHDEQHGAGRLGFARLWNLGQPDVTFDVMPRACALFPSNLGEVVRPMGERPAGRGTLQLHELQHRARLAEPNDPPLPPFRHVCYLSYVSICPRLTRRSSAAKQPVLLFLDLVLQLPTRLPSPLTQVTQVRADNPFSHLFCSGGQRSMISLAWSSSSSSSSRESAGRRHQTDSHR